MIEASCLLETCFHEFFPALYSHNSILIGKVLQQSFLKNAILLKIKTHPDLTNLAARDIKRNKL